MEWSGHAIRLGLDNRHLIKEGNRGNRGVVACRIIVSAPVPVPFLWTLDFRFGTWIWDLDLGSGFGIWIWECICA